MPPPEDVAGDARTIMRLADKVAIASIDSGDGAPFISLTGVATQMDATPVLLLSALARHTQNVQADSRASLLFDGTGNHTNPLTEARLTVRGRIIESKAEEAARRFITRNPKAFYAGFSDFGFYRLEIEEAHYVGGFGVALSIPADILRLPDAAVSPLREGELALVQQLNSEHGQELATIAVKMLSGEDGPWQVTGFDPEGLDLRARKQRRRLSFGRVVHEIDEVQPELMRLFDQAASL
jgi:putative heme iron utilization protein